MYLWYNVKNKRFKVHSVWRNIRQVQKCCIIHDHKIKRFSISILLLLFLSFFLFPSLADTRPQLSVVVGLLHIFLFTGTIWHYPEVITPPLLGLTNVSLTSSRPPVNNPMNSPLKLLSNNMSNTIFQSRNSLQNVSSSFLTSIEGILSLIVAHCKGLCLGLSEEEVESL